MPLNPAKVLVGTADQQATTGAVRSGAVIEAASIPNNFTAAQTTLASMTTNSGYVSEDGLSLSPTFNTNDIREWNGATVRRILNEFNGEFSFSLIQCGYEEWCQALGSDNVTQTAATSTHGEQLHIKMGAHLAPRQAYCFALKDGDAQIIIVVPNGQITSIDEISFNSSDAISLPLTLTAYDDGTGESIHIFVDDGIKTS